METQELSKEIFSMERHLTEMKRQYKTLLARSKNQKDESVRSEMNEMAKKLEQKTEIFICAKKILKKKTNL